MARRCRSGSRASAAAWPSAKRIAGNFARCKSGAGQKNKKTALRCLFDGAECSTSRLLGWSGWGCFSFGFVRLGFGFFSLVMGFGLGGGSVSLGAGYVGFGIG